MDSHYCFKLHWSYLISFNLSKVGEIFWVKSKRTVSKFSKRKRKFLCCAHPLHKPGAWNLKVSCRSRSTTTEKCTKKGDTRAKSFFFANLRACLHEGGGPQVGEVTWGGLPHLTCKLDHFQMRNYMNRRVTPPKRVPHLSGVPHLHVNRP